MATDAWRRTTLGRIAHDGRSTRGETPERHRRAGKTRHSGWPAGNFLRSGPFGSQLHASDYVSEGIPVVMPRDFSGGSISNQTVARVSTAKAAELKGFQVRAGDVLLARRGEMGRSTHVQASQDGWLCGTGVLRIRPNRLLDGRFLTHLLRSAATVSWLEDHAVGQTLPSLNVRTVAQFPLLLPSIDEQRRIARVLAAVERAIVSSRTVIAHNRRLRDRFWRQVLTYGPRRSSGLAGGMDPMDWPARPIGDLCVMTNGFGFKKADRSPAGLPIVRIGNLNGSRRFHRYAGRPAPGWTVEVGDLLFAWAGVKGSSFGPCLWPGPRGVLNQHIFRIRAKEGVAKEWLFEALRVVTRSIEEKARGFKCDLQHIRKSDVTEHLVPVPPFEVQCWIAARSKAMAAIEAAERDSLDTLIRLGRGLSQDLLSGRIRTPPD